MTEYVCIRKCYFGRGETVDGKAPPRRIYEPGDRLVFGPGEEVPRHFIPVPDYSPVPPVKQPTKIDGLRAPVDVDALEAQKAKKRTPPKKKEEL